jgi:DNA-directed RNA polymerase III subunit RPC3
MFTILLRRGRLTTRLLQEHTQLNRRQLRHGLALLIQQNLVYHFFDVDTEETMYEANQAAAYALIRSGKFMEVAEGKYGSTGLDAVHSLLLLGQAKVSDLVDTCVEREHKRKQKKHKHNGGANGGANDSGVVNGMNGDSENYGYTENLESTLFQLLQAGYVEPVTRRLFRSPTDTRNEIEKNILKEKYDGSTKGTKQKDELKHIVRNQMQALRAEDINLQPVGKKRLLNGHGNGSGKNGHSKRRKFSHDDHAINGNRGYEYTSVRLEVGF